MRRVAAAGPAGGAVASPGRARLAPLGAALALLVAGCTSSTSPGDGDDARAAALDLARFVDPMIGTRGPGNVIPGPSLPHGMVKLSPDSDVEPLGLDAYEWSAERIEGFSHTHLEGPGGSAYGYSQVLLQPAVGEPGYVEAAYASRFSHASEVAEPGYYAVTLDDPGVRVELTATGTVGVHRYTFPRTSGATGRARVLVDASHTRGLPRSGWVEVVGEREIRGHSLTTTHPLVALATATAPGTTSDSPIYFHARFDRPFAAAGTWSGRAGAPGTVRAEGPDVGAWAEFDTAEGEAVMVKVGISSIDVEQARANLEREVPGWDFEAVRAAARRAWNQTLARVVVEGAAEAPSDEPDLVRFYTGLYHALLTPNDHDEGGRFWSGADGTGAVFDASVLGGDGRRGFHTDDWCLWDTFRTSHPLQVLVEPERRAAILESYVHLYEQGGWVPKCTWNATGYSRVMIGNHASCLVLDAWRKGIRDFDVDTAYEGLRKAAYENNPDLLAAFGFCGYMNLGTPRGYLERGYVPFECDVTQAVSMTLEHAYDDWCLAELASDLGHADDASDLFARARNYRNVWNPESGFMQPRLASGEFREPFDPAERDVGFTEADAWKYTWFVPQDVAGLVDLVGGDEAFLAKLDAFFEGGHYDSTNQPGFHVPWLHSYAGAPHRSQEIVAALRESEFGADPGGLPGNDDAGSTSAWFVLAALGLYPVTPGEPVYVLGAPLFERVTLHLDREHHPGETFLIEAPRTGPGDVHVQAATLDGAPLDRAWIAHDEITAGGTLVLRLGPDPSGWATGPGAAPPSPLRDRLGP